eukprot:1396918-Karenia_brevis.AAC.1
MDADEHEWIWMDMDGFYSAMQLHNLVHLESPAPMFLDMDGYGWIWDHATLLVIFKHTHSQSYQSGYGQKAPPRWPIAGTDHWLVIIKQ